MNIAKMPYDPLNAWLPAGSGNYQRTLNNGNYRESCNTVKLKISCERDPSEQKAKYWHCNKLDCSSCFVTASSIIARSLNDRLTEFRRTCYTHGIPIGKIVHFSMLLGVDRHHLTTYKKYVNFKNKVLYPLFKDIGVIGGVLFLHVWSSTCTICGKTYFQCLCPVKHLKKTINIHVHVVGFGYLMDINKFRKKYPNYIYRNHLPRRTNAYYTTFYLLSKGALWRDPGGMLKPSYTYFGFLHPSKFSMVRKHRTQMTDNCQKCKRPRIISEIEGKPVKTTVLYTVKITKKHYQIKDIEGLRKLVRKTTGLDKMKKTIKNDPNNKAERPNSLSNSPATSSKYMIKKKEIHLNISVN